MVFFININSSDTQKDAEHKSEQWRNTVFIRVHNCKVAVTGWNNSEAFTEGGRYHINSVTRFYIGKDRSEYLCKGDFPLAVKWDYLTSRWTFEEFSKLRKPYDVLRLSWMRDLKKGKPKILYDYHTSFIRSSEPVAKPKVEQEAVAQAKPAPPREVVPTGKPSEEHGIYADIEGRTIASTVSSDVESLILLGLLKLNQNETSRIVEALNQRLYFKKQAAGTNLKVWNKVADIIGSSKGPYSSLLGYYVDAKTAVINVATKLKDTVAGVMRRLREAFELFGVEQDPRGIATLEELIKADYPGVKVNFNIASQKDLQLRVKANLICQQERLISELQTAITRTEMVLDENVSEVEKNEATIKLEKYRKMLHIAEGERVRLMNS